MSEALKVIKLTWENGKEFKMTCTKDGTDPVIVLHMEENGHLPTLWENAQKICELFFNRLISDIGNEMKVS